MKNVRSRSPLTAVLVVALLLVIGLVAYGVGWQAWGAYHHRQAEQALARRDLDAARRHLAKCLEVWPHSADLHFQAARTARRAGAHDDAARHLDLCRKSGGVPEAIELEKALTDTQQGGRGYEGWLQACVVKDHPDRELILEALASGHLKTFRLGEALGCLRLWLERRPDDVQALVWQGRVREILRSRSEAVADFARAVELDPDHAEARERLAAQLLHLHRAKEAVEHFEWLLRQRPDDPDALLGLARCRAELGEAGEALRLLEPVLRQRPDSAPALALRGKLALGDDKTDEAEAWLRKSLAIAPAERETVYTLHQCLQRAGKTAEAKAVEDRLKQVEADLDRIGQVTQAVTRSPHDAALRCEAGQILMRNGHDDEGKRWLDSALREDPKHAPTHRALAEYYGKRHQPDLAELHRRLAGP
jgi:tetratricopeptide (TPR) repeat protein